MLLSPSNRSRMLKSSIALRIWQKPRHCDREVVTVLFIADISAYPLIAVCGIALRKAFRNNTIWACVSRTLGGKSFISDINIEELRDILWIAYQVCKSHVSPFKFFIAIQTARNTSKVSITPNTTCIRGCTVSCIFQWAFFGISTTLYI